MSFSPSFTPPEHSDQTQLWFVFDQSKLLLKLAQDNCDLPDVDAISPNNAPPTVKIYIGDLDGKPCYGVRLNPQDPLPDDYQWMDLRTLTARISEELFWIAGLANHILDWDETHRYCGRCGNPTRDQTEERAKVCPTCNLINYPRLSPAIIVAVIKDGQILLARNHRFRAPFYSVLAGFVEPGETLEECVKREIREEVQIEVKNIRYFGSQPWPFPNSLMVGFVADHADGEIAIDNKEIMEAGWFSPDNLPLIPSGISIAGRLIQWFVDSCLKNRG